MSCEICEKELRFSWTDTHGVGQCINCGAPYRIYHYDGDHRLDKPPELQIKEEYRERIKQYFRENQRKIPSGFSFGYAGTTQELATREDAEKFYSWMESNT